MASCEKCWREAGMMQTGNTPEAYHQLIKENNCTPEEQAGDGQLCTSCNRKTIHMYTHYCVNPECDKFGRI